MAAVNTSVGVGGSGTSLTTGSVTPSGSNTAVYAAAAGDASYASDAKYNGSGGTSLTKVSADQAMAFFNGGHFNGWGAAGSPTSSTTGWTSFGATSQGASATSYVFLTGVDPTTPFGSEQTANNLDAPVTSIVASRSLTGLNPGQLVVAGLGVLTFAAITVTANNGSTTVVQVQQGSGGTKNSTAILYGVADGSGNLTLSALIDQGATSDLIAWALSAVPVNDAAGGGGSTISAAAGAATASSITGSSTAVAAETAAAGAATASTLTGSAQANSTRTAAAGVATVSTVTGSSTASASETAAAGVATAGTMTGSSTAVASFVAAAGAATSATLSSDLGPSIITPAAGVATASSMAGQSTSVASFVPATGIASTASMAGNPPASGSAADGAASPQRRKRRVLGEEVFEPVKAEAPAVPPPVEAPAPASTPVVPAVSAPAEPGLPEVMRAIAESLPAPTVTLGKSKGKRSGLKPAAPPPQDDDDDDQQAIEAAMALLLH